MLEYLATNWILVEKTREIRWIVGNGGQSGGVSDASVSTSSKRRFLTQPIPIEARRQRKAIQKSAMKRSKSNPGTMVASVWHETLCVSTSKADLGRRYSSFPTSQQKSENFQVVRCSSNILMARKRNIQPMDWSIDWLINSPIDGSIDWLIDWLSEW